MHSRLALIKKRMIGTGWAWTLLLLLQPSVSAQSPGSLLQNFLPAPPTQAATPSELIPLAEPDDAGEVIVEEEGEGIISLKVRDASLKQVVSMIAETQRINVVFAAAEDIEISGSLVRVPWRQALETVIASTGHTWTNDKGILVVTAIQAAETIAPRAGGRHVETFELDFAKAVDVDQTVQGLLSPAGKSWVISSSSTDNRQTREVVAVVDFPGNLAQISQYICQIDQPPRQVLIQANILQVDLADDCRSGVNLRQLANISGNQLALTSVGFANGVAGDATTPNPNATNTSFLQLTGGSLNGLIEALKTTTDAKSLASTEILAVSGQEARLQSGSQLGFRVTTTTQTSTLESVEFLDVGVVLTVTPQVTRDGRVLMRIKPEVSDGQVDPNTGLPAEDTVEVETDVMLSNGQGLVIGGLIQEIDSNVQSKIPWLGDIPYAGIFFQRRQLIKSRAEIIVTLIPHVMPYSAIGVAQNDHRMMRTQQPLLSPPLNRFPRPYEASLTDTFDNPRPLCIGRHCEASTCEPVIAQPTQGIVPVSPTPMFPTPAHAHPQGPLVFPPAGTQGPAPVPQQAQRFAPTYR